MITQVNYIELTNIMGPHQHSAVVDLARANFLEPLRIFSLISFLWIIETTYCYSIWRVIWTTTCDINFSPTDFMQCISVTMLISFLIYQLDCAMLIKDCLQCLHTMINDIHAYLTLLEWCYSRHKYILAILEESQLLPSFIRICMVEFLHLDIPEHQTEIRYYINTMHDLI